MKVAIVGSGVSGLAAAYLFSRAHEVTLYERMPALGMDAHAVQVGGGARVDVPVRVFYAGHYRGLTALYRSAGVETEPVNYASSYSQLNGMTYFRFRNVRLGQRSFPLALNRHVRDAAFWSIIPDAVRFFRNAPRDLAEGRAAGLTLADYLAAGGYSEAFARRFLFPAYATICTCSYDSVGDYPAEVVIDFIANSRFQPAHRVRHGVDDAVRRLSAGAQHIRAGTTVCQIRQNGAGVTVREEGGLEQTFDHVIVATQANHAHWMLPDLTADERELLASFRYERSEVVTHRDPRLMPAARREWATTNVMIAEGEPMPMASVWMNSVYPQVRDAAPVYQTWNPLVAPRPELELQRSAFERPVVTQRSLAALKTLERLHAQPDRRIWFCGAYASYGIPLQESGVQSALSVARRLGVSLAE